MRCAVTWCKGSVLETSAFPLCAAHNTFWHCSYECERADRLRGETMLADYVRRVSGEGCPEPVPVPAPKP